MIISKTIIIKSDNSKSYYEQLGYVFINKETEIKVSDLKRNSLKRILVKCDFCDNEKSIRYQDYNKVTKNQTEPYYCEHCKWFKTKNTMVKLYGVENASQSETIKEQKIITINKNYGVKNPSQSEEIKKRKEETSLINNGTKYWTSNPELYLKSLKKGLKIKKYFDIYYQGTYELDFLNKYYDKIKIENGFSIKYEINNIEHIYYPDFYISELDLIIEIKSTYWFNKNKNKCLMKEEYVKKEHNYMLILDKNYSEFESIIK